MRVVVCIALEEQDPWMLAPARLHEPLWISGGVRSLHETAVAAAAAGYETEVRGDFHGTVLRELSEAAGVHVHTPSQPRRAQPDDLLLVPDGVRDPGFFLRVALMPSTPVYLAFAPPGLFGWSFTPGWEYVDAGEVDPDSVGRSEHYRAIHEMGFAVWSNAHTTGGEFEANGVPVAVVGQATPLPFPESVRKDVDVVTVGDNRWTALTRRALDGFGGTWRELPAMPQDELQRELGRGHVFVHCMRIEGHSRLGSEARRVGTVPVGLASNRFAIGFEMADSLEAVRPLVESLLADREDLARRQQRARAGAVHEFSWDAYVERVGDAIAASRSEGVWRGMAREIHDRAGGLEHALENLRARRALRVAEAARKVVTRP
jgi:hypothetical protein